MLLPEDFIFVTIKRFLITRGWQILGGEPPNGTSNDIIRIVIRPRSTKGRFHSLGALKVDLISKRGHTLLLTEVKPDYSEYDRRKLDLITTTRLLDLKDALWERCKIHEGDIKSIFKSLAFSYGRKLRVDEQYIHFRVKGDGSVLIIKGKQMSSIEV